MSCCGTATNGGFSNPDFMMKIRKEELSRNAYPLSENVTKYVFSIPTIHCGGCISHIERLLKKMDGVLAVRVNLTLKRLNLELAHDGDIVSIVDALEGAGFPASPIDLGEDGESSTNLETKRLLRALAVAGFGAANIMLLSVSVWSGAEGATRDLFHLISALIAVPTVAYSGQVFFKSAYKALSGGRLNMDVPISLAVVLALGMSLFETMNGGVEAYFDAAVTLLFFLLIGRTLDQVMREKARNAVVSLSKLAAKGANHIGENSAVTYLPIDEIEVGMNLRVFAGDRVPVDGIVINGQSDLDRSLVTGESVPVTLQAGDYVEAGVTNLTGMLDIQVTKPANQSFLAEVMKMLEAAENGRSSYVRVADRLARIYAPAVHLAALLAFIGWMIATGGDWQVSLLIATSVLIITCPCALGLAVPVVHVIGATRLFKEGILMRDGSALERLADIDHAVFDKTGTLTMNAMSVQDVADLDDAYKPLIKALAERSSHPVSKAIAVYLKDVSAVDIGSTQEVAGGGIEALVDGLNIRLGAVAWACSTHVPNSVNGTVFSIDGVYAGSFSMAEHVRENAGTTVRDLEDIGISCALLSGDKEAAVNKVARIVGIETAHCMQKPADKCNHLYTLRDAGKHTLMVGDGLNDAPSLAAAHVSMAPATAADVGRQAADFVFTRDSLAAVPFAHTIALRAKKLVKQNFGLAILYNCIAVPLALAGMITPLFAAIAMSASSIIVIGNSLRLARGGKAQ